MPLLYGRELWYIIRVSIMEREISGNILKEKMQLAASGLIIIKN
jgi:hypothetical protein